MQGWTLDVCVGFYLDSSCMRMYFESVYFGDGSGIAVMLPKFYLKDYIFEIDVIFVVM